MREQRVTTPDGHIWYVRRRWSKRQLPWKRRADYELSPAKRDAIPVLTDTDELVGPLAAPLIGLFSVDAEVGLLVGLALLALVALGVLALVGVVREWVVPFLVANIGWIGTTLAAIAILVVLDRLTRPWFIEAESARLFHTPRRIWRIQGCGAASAPSARSPQRSPTAASTTSAASSSSLSDPRHSSLPSPAWTPRHPRRRANEAVSA